MERENYMNMYTDEEFDKILKHVCKRFNISSKIVEGVLKQAVDEICKDKVLTPQSCPFCGCNEIAISGGEPEDDGLCSAVCERCGAALDIEGDKQTAIEAWNHRVSPVFTREELKIIADILKYDIINNDTSTKDNYTSELKNIKKKIIKKCEDIYFRKD